MKLSTRSRYGTRLILDMVQNDNGSAVQLSEIARRQDISVKYLEQIIIPLKKAKYIKGIRGAKGGYLLQKKPKDITVGEIVSILEGGETICECTEKPSACKKSKKCVTRQMWIDAGKAMFDKLNSITFADLMNGECGPNL